MTTLPWKILFAVGGLAFAAAASAQFKYVDANGRITYSDRPPPASAKLLNEKKPGDAPPAAALPFELQQAVDKYPVTLFTGNRCSPCDDARAYLRSRGVPFTEKTVTTDDDIVLFKQQSPDGTAPVVQVGTRRAVGFAQPTLAALLDNAGYPATSTLPRDYQAALPTPLAPTPPGARTTAQATQATSAQRQGTNATPAATGNAPPGFRF